jgi:ATP-binding cassette subfamily C (CFTR/MRP) protein 1
MFQSSIAELRQGTITVDRVDVRTIELNDLRHRLSLVPQESVLFVSAFSFLQAFQIDFLMNIVWVPARKPVRFLQTTQGRHSLTSFSDPQGSKTDAELITILQQAHLLPPHGSQTPGDSKFDLGAIIQEGG